VAALWAVNAIACVPVARSGPDRVDPAWGVYLGSPRHDGSARESLLVEPQTVWKRDAGRAVPGSPAITAGVIAVGTSDRAVVLMDRANGQILWRRHVPGPVAGGPLLADKLLYVATQAVPTGRVLALHVRTGKTVWQTSTGGVTAPLAFSGGLVIAATDAGNVVALDGTNGAERWRQPLRLAVRAAPVPTPAGIAVATIGDTLYLLDPRSGAITNRLVTPGSVLGTPATDGRRIYFATTQGRVQAITVPALAVLWETSVQDAVYGAPALVGDTLYVMNAAGTLWRIPVDQPHAARSVPLHFAATAGPTPLADGVLVVGVSGEVMCLGGDDSVRWRLRRAGPMAEPPLVRDQQLVLVDGDGIVEVLR
jgi:outer membrane protein assembly factor BamB